MLQISNLGSWNNGYKVMTSGNVCNYLPMEINKVAILVHKVEIYSVIPAKNAFCSHFGCEEGVQRVAMESR